uniref:Uncharacterized protein n=1 Tax=Panagrolaimus sp. PS1159 TaxID=55785 RepID=A0AC35GSH6_9BILA
MQGNSATLIGGRRFLPHNLNSWTTTTPFTPTPSATTPTPDLPGFLDGWEVLIFFLIMLFIIPPIVICFKKKCIHTQRRGYEHVI